MGQIILPKIHTDIITKPLIFLAGPIRGAPKWQDEAAKIILNKEPLATIASPTRRINENLQKYLAEGTENYFERQRAWERHYLDLASKRGTIMFWLPGEAEHKCEKAYGAMTRIELGQWMTNYRHDNSIRFCVGSDGKFSELGTILYDLKLDAPDKKVFGTLEETCEEAIQLALLK